jgi:hypothetical protein
MEKVVSEAIPIDIDLTRDGENLEARTKIIDDAKTSAYKNFLLQGLGGRILKLMSDIDLRVIFVNFPAEMVILTSFFAVCNDSARASPHFNFNISIAKMGDRTKKLFT